MLKKTLYIENPCYLNVTNDLLQITNKSDGSINTQPFHEIGFLFLENQQTTISLAVFQKSAENNVSIVFCDKTHHPISSTYNFNTNTIQSQIINSQINVKEQLKNSIWKQIIYCKIYNQALLLRKYQKESNYLLVLLKKIKSNDSSNIEGLASRYYWKNLFNIEGFTREQEGESPNDLLNYGYSILRAAMARAIAGSGLLPHFGVHHHNKYNPFPLADDMMEPYRPFVDEIVLKILADDKNAIVNKLTKVALLKVVGCDVMFKKLRRPLMIGLTYSASSFVKVIQKKSKRIIYPKFE